MKKIIIVNNNLKVGGIQKSLYNLLWAIEKQYDITLLLFSKTGVYAERLPPGVKVIECDSWFRYLGVSQSDCKKRISDTVIRGFLAVVSRVFGRKAAIRLMLSTQSMLPENYDCAISFLHNGRRKSFYGGAQDFVLNRIKADKKVAFIHCDYRNCGANHEENNRDMESFDRIAACSDGCRKAFESVLPHLHQKCITVRNCHRYEEIRTLAQENPVKYSENRLHIITVARLSHEKGIERAIEGAAYALGKGVPVTLHIVGDGAMREVLQTLVHERGISEFVHFYGEQSNPYRLMKNADLFLLTSYHEAAPMVLEEARCLGLPVLTVETTSSQDMVTKQRCGWVCENSQEGINRALTKVLSDKQMLKDLSEQLKKCQMSNSEAIDQFAKLVE